MHKKAVLFDCDGVLINSEEIGFKVLSEMLDDELVKNGGTPPMYTREEFVEMLSGITYPQFMNRMKVDFLARTGVALTEDFYPKLRDAIDAAQDKELKAIDGVRTLLSKLKAAGIPFAVASNSGREGLEKKLKQTGLYDFFAPHVYSRDDVKEPKPAPDLFLYAADRLGGFKPDECLVVEDSITGTLAGAAARMHVIGFVSAAHRLDHETEYLIRAGASSIGRGMEEVTDHIFRMTGKPRPAVQPRPPIRPRGPGM